MCVSCICHLAIRYIPKSRSANLFKQEVSHLGKMTLILDDSGAGDMAILLSYYSSGFPGKNVKNKK